MHNPKLDYASGSDEHIQRHGQSCVLPPGLPVTTRNFQHLNWSDLLLWSLATVGIVSLFYPPLSKLVWGILYTPFQGIFWLFGHPLAASYAVFLGLACMAVLLFPLTILLPVLENKSHHEWWRLPVAVLSYPVLLLAVLALWGVVSFF